MRLLALPNLIAILLVLAFWPLTANAAGGGGGRGDEPSSGSGSYVEIAPLTVTLFRNDAPAGALTARIVLHMESSDGHATVKAAKVKLRDALLRELHRLVERESHNGPKVDVDLVKTRMLKISRRQLGSDVVTDVFVQALLRRGG